MLSYLEKEKKEKGLPKNSKGEYFLALIVDRSTVVLINICVLGKYLWDVPRLRQFFNPDRIQEKKFIEFGLTATNKKKDPEEQARFVNYVESLLREKEVATIDSGSWVKVEGRHTRGNQFAGFAFA